MKYLIKSSYSIFLSVLLLACNAQTNTALTADEFQKNIEDPAVQILDVRTPSEYYSGHIKNSLQADWTDKKEFNRRIEFIDKTKPVYVYCLSGGRSGEAAKEMRAAGYTEVYELTGGINAWKADGLPLAGKADEKQMSIEQFNTAINAPGTVLVDFGAEWCPPCKTMEPVLKSLQANNPGKFSLLKVDGGKDEAIMKQYAVTALPVFIIFKDGKQFWRKDGTASEKEIANAL